MTHRELCILLVWALRAIKLLSHEFNRVFNVIVTFAHSSVLQTQLCSMPDDKDMREKKERLEIKSEVKHDRNRKKSVRNGNNTAMNRN